MSVKHCSRLPTECACQPSNTPVNHYSRLTFAGSPNWSARGVGHVPAVAGKIGQSPATVFEAPNAAASPGEQYPSPAIAGLVTETIWNAEKVEGAGVTVVRVSRVTDMSVGAVIGCWPESASCVCCACVIGLIDAVTCISKGWDHDVCSE